MYNDIRLFKHPPLIYNAFPKISISRFPPVRIHPIVLMLHDALADKRVFADITQIDQILINLTKNARDAMPGGGKLRIETGVVSMDEESAALHGLSGPGEHALISVSDSGLGMDEKTREHIFEPFFTTKEVGKGTGLGLASVYGIVKQHNGSIAVESVLNKGTVFRIYFPLVHAIEKSLPLRSPPACGGNETILVAEDDPGVRRLIVEILHRHGYATIEATDGHEALQKFLDNKKDIVFIVIDVVMPKMNGKEVYDQARYSSGVKTLFTSGYARDVIIDKGVEDTMVDFIKRPIMPQEFLMKVREVLDR